MWRQTNKKCCLWNLWAYWAILNYFKRTKASFFANSDSLTVLQVSQIPNSPKPTIFMPTVTTDTNRLATLPLAHAHGVTIQENSAVILFSVLSWKPLRNLLTCKLSYLLGSLAFRTDIMILFLLLFNLSWQGFPMSGQIKSRQALVPSKHQFSWWYQE